MNTTTADNSLARLRQSNQRLRIILVTLGLLGGAAAMTAMAQNGRFSSDPVVGVTSEGNDLYAVHRSGRVSVLDLSVRRSEGPRWEWKPVDLSGF